jgi:hypothetical protein
MEKGRPGPHASGSSSDHAAADLLYCGAPWRHSYDAPQAGAKQAAKPTQTGYSVGTLDRFDGVGPARGIDPGRGDGARDPKCRRVVLM